MVDTRRDFVRKSAVFGVLGLAGRKLPGASRSVSIRVDSDVAGAPVKWATGYLEQVLKSKGVTTQASADAFVVSVSNAKPAIEAEAFRLVPASAGVTALASDDRGFVYGLLELADRVQYG